MWVNQEYKLVNYSYNCTSNYITDNYNRDITYIYTLDIEEIESLKVDSLVIAGVEVTPYKYSEMYNDGIIIEAKIKLSKEDDKKLDMATKENVYFYVKRKGISDEVKKMRFGKVIWSENDGYIKRHINLIEDIYDNKNPISLGLFQPEYDNIMNMLSYVKNLNDELLKLLVSKDLLLKEELEKISIVAKNNIEETKKEYYRMTDIDKF